MIKLAAVPVTFWAATRSLPVTCRVLPARIERLPFVLPTRLPLFVTLLSFAVCFVSLVP